MAVTLGGGLGGFAAVAAQPTYGATFVTPTRVLMIKSAKATWNPHLVYGGPYLEGNITVVPGAARVSTYQDANGTLTGDVTSTAHALLLKTALASTASLTQLGTTTAYELGGSGGASMGVADTNGSYFDMQMGVPTTDGTQKAYNYHSCVITKAEWVFDRTGLVTYSYDFDAQQVETSTALITPTYPTNSVAFSSALSTSVFEIGAFGSEATVDGMRKCTITLERPMATDRIYLGSANKESPVTNAYVKLTASIDADFTPALKTALWDLYLANTPISIIAKAVGSTIGTSGSSNTFGLNLTNAYIDSAGEPSLDGPDVIKGTLSLTGTVDAAADAPLKATLITADTAL
jgi:hypothetical protein